MHEVTVSRAAASALVVSLALAAFGEDTEGRMGSVKVTVASKAGKNIGVHVESADRSTTGEVDEETGMPIELGKVAWLTDLDEASKRSKHSSKPIMLLFDEVPGCGACKDFGRGALSNPLVLEAANEFVCLFAQNNSNDPLKKAFLKRFKEPGWKGPVVRFVDADGKDVIPRRTGVYRTVALLGRMAEALKATKQDVPGWLELVGKQSADTTETATFAMNCYWAGEKELGGIDGVISTKIGALNLEEVVELEFDPKVVSYEELLKKARQVNCTRHVFARNDDQARSATNLLGEKRVTQTDKAVTIHTRQQYHLWHRMEYNYLPLLPIQASRVNSALGKGESPDKFLSPGQRRVAKRILAIVKADKEAALEVFKPLKPSRAARAMGMYMAQLDRVISKAEEDRKRQGKPGNP